MLQGQRDLDAVGPDAALGAGPAGEAQQGVLYQVVTREFGRIDSDADTHKDIRCNEDEGHDREQFHRVNTGIVEVLCTLAQYKDGRGRKGHADGIEENGKADILSNVSAKNSTIMQMAANTVRLTVSTSLLSSRFLNAAGSMPSWLMAYITRGLLAAAHSHRRVPRRTAKLK